MASISPGLALGTADSIGNTVAAQAAKVATGNVEAEAGLTKEGIDKSLAIVGG